MCASGLSTFRGTILVYLRNALCFEACRLSGCEGASEVYIRVRWCSLGSKKALIVYAGALYTCKLYWCARAAASRVHIIREDCTCENLLTALK